MQKIAGFNLLEILITLSIIGILSILCFPIYSQHIIHARRLEAEVNLIKLANALEKYYLLKNTYENATLEELNFSKRIAGDQYDLKIVSVTSSDFLIKASPIGNQAKKDIACASLSLNSAGIKKITGTGELTECWQ
ncbi:MAG TPA: type IV pilin protein [Gammaproteobacteria bacterium]|nr:type IV pilin protein [Gammaproteobacteria bacterium]